MKLIRCNNCEDVVRLIETKWRKCECGKSGGQYNGDSLSATIGGDCEVIGIRNDFFATKPFSKARNESDDKGQKNVIIQGEYEGDVQLHRIESGDGPKLKMDFEKIDKDTLKVTFTDDRKYTMNLKGDKSPKVIELPASDSPSFKKEKVVKELKKENVDYKKIIKEGLNKI